MQWTLVAAALTLGGSVRVGLEDNFYLPDGDDGALQRRPRRAGAADDARTPAGAPATVAEARALLGAPRGRAA